MEKETIIVNNRFFESGKSEHTPDWCSDYEVYPDYQTAYDNEGFLYGAEDVLITKENQEKLKAGGVIVLTPNGEYAIYLKFEQ